MCAVGSQDLAFSSVEKKEKAASRVEGKKERARKKDRAKLLPCSPAEQWLPAKAEVKKNKRDSTKAVNEHIELLVSILQNPTECITQSKGCPCEGLGKFQSIQAI